MFMSNQFNDLEKQLEEILTTVNDLKKDENNKLNFDLNLLSRWVNNLETIACELCRNNKCPGNKKKMKTIVKKLKILSLVWV